MDHEYVGLQPNDAVNGAFGSPPQEPPGTRDLRLRRPRNISPCFADGSINSPLGCRPASWSRGWRGPKTRAGAPAGEVARALGRRQRFVFGSTSASSPRGTTAACRSTSATSPRARPRSSPRADRRDDDRQRHRRARHLRRRKARPDRSTGRQRRRRQPDLRPLHARRSKPLGRRSRPPNGALFAGMTADGRRCSSPRVDLSERLRRLRRPLPGERRRLQRERGPGLDRDRRQRRHRRLRTGRQRLGRTLERAGRLDRELRRGRDRGRGRGRLGRRHRLLPQPGEPRAGPPRWLISRTSTGPSPVRRRISSPPSAPKIRWSATRWRMRRSAKPRTSRPRPTASSRSSRASISWHGPVPTVTRDLPKRRRRPTRLCLLPPVERCSEHRHQADQERPQPDR